MPTPFTRYLVVLFWLVILTWCLIHGVFVENSGEEHKKTQQTGDGANISSNIKKIERKTFFDWLKSYSNWKGILKSITHPHAAYISRWNVESNEISDFSPIGDNADCMAGPRTNPSVWNRDNKEICVIRSLALVAFAT